MVSGINLALNICQKISNFGNVKYKGAGKDKYIIYCNGCEVLVVEGSGISVKKSDYYEGLLNDYNADFFERNGYLFFKEDNKSLLGSITKEALKSKL